MSKDQNTKTTNDSDLSVSSGSVPVLVSRKTFRSKPYVNMDDDMVRVTIDMPYRHWCIHKKEILAQNRENTHCE